MKNETGRIEAFSDGVFAIAVTLLILEIIVFNLLGRYASLDQKTRFLLQRRERIMGTWDTSIFGNDAAADWVAFFEKNPTLATIEETFDQAIAESEEYLDSDFAAEALAAAETLARAKTKSGEESHGTEEIDQWAQSFSGTISHELIQKAVTVIDNVLAENSELNDLWQEAEEEYDVWKSEVLALKHRLLE